MAIRGVSWTFVLAALVGCHTPLYAPPNIAWQVEQVTNPLFVPGCDADSVWETVVDVTDDYFRIEREEPVRNLGGAITEGRLETHPEVASTLFEPWRHDSADGYERLESTLQSMRRRAAIRVVPERGGYFVDVAVFKELENVPQPLLSTSGSATFHYDSGMNRIANPVGQQDVQAGWIPVGRDEILERRMLGQLRSRFGGVGTPEGPPPKTWPLVPN